VNCDGRTRAQASGGCGTKLEKPWPRRPAQEPGTEKQAGTERAGQSLLLLLEIERGGVHAEALPGGFRPVGKQVSQVGVAAAAFHLDAAHPITVVRLGGHVFAGDGRVEAGPSAARLEFGFRVEQRSAAADAAVDALLVMVPVFAGEGGFCGGTAGHGILRGVELLLPFLFRLVDFFRHRCSPCAAPSTLYQGSEPQGSAARRRRLRRPWTGWRTAIYG